MDDEIEMYYNSVGHNTSLILGLTPNPEGLMPEHDVKRLAIIVAFSFSQKKKEIDVYLIGGQSNATGQGYMANLPTAFEIDKSVQMIRFTLIHLEFWNWETVLQTKLIRN